MIDCKRCKSPRILMISGKCNDLCSYTFMEAEGNGYVPDGVGVGGGDYISIEVCLECGQLQDDWPKPDPEM